MRILLKFFGISLFSLFTVYVGCERPTSPETPNEAPNTTVANVPVDSSTIFALATLHWDGEDSDGFIAGYEYRYITRHLTSDSMLIDTAVTEWKSTQETSITIPFESSAVLNFQRFQVRAIDNNGDRDPTPAEKRFYTYQTVRPTTTIEYPPNDKPFFAIDQVTDWWQGIPLTFTASDEDGALVEFAWAVDEGEWQWIPDTTLYIPPEYFTPLEGEHIIRVTSRDNTNLIDLVGDTVKIKLIRPTFDKQILIVDETDEALFTGGLSSFGDADVDSFYADVFGTSEMWDFKNNGMPPKTKLGQYKLVIWHADNSYDIPANVHKLPQHIDDIIDYLNVGGDFIMSGWRILKSFAQAEPFPKTFEEGSFIHDYLHIVQADETPLIPTDFTHGIGWRGFSNVRVDSTKLQEFPFLGKLGYVNVMPRRAGFTDKIYTYGNDPETGLPNWRGYPVGIRYYGTSFDTIVLGFPMFLLVKQHAETMAAQMLQSLGY